MEKKEIYLPNGEVHIVRPDGPIYESKVSFDKPEGLKVQEWVREGKRRQDLRAETQDNYNYAKIELQSDRPVAIGITGDWHLGSNVDYDMWHRDIDIMAEHPLVAGNFFMGDLVAAMNFNPGQDEQILNWEEQRQMMTSALDHVGEERILGIFKGNHCFKFERKYGTSKYAELSQKYNAPVFYGPSFIDMNINDVNYRLMGSHRLRGNSIYSFSHPATRGHKEYQNLDVVFAGHNHKKGTNSQPMKEFDGARKTHSVMIGPYEQSTEYTKDSGWGKQQNAELGMCWIILNHDKKMVRVEDTDEMLETMGGYL